MAALSHFISRLGLRVLPFFKLLKKQDNFEWDQEAKKVFEELKAYLTSPPVLIAPNEGNVLLLYISATTHMVSTALVVETKEDGHVLMV